LQRDLLTELLRTGGMVWHATDVELGGGSGSSSRTPARQHALFDVGVVTELEEVPSAVLETARSKASCASSRATCRRGERTSALILAMTDFLQELDWRADCGAQVQR
jgi:hypothetical protein